MSLAASFEGVGLHTGSYCKVEVIRSRPGSGIQFQRRDLSAALPIPARASSVVATKRHTVVGRENVTVQTVEHLMAALASQGLWDASIELEGPEIPILDGSSLPFTTGISHLGRSPRPPLRPNSSIEVCLGKSRASVNVAPSLSVVCTVDFDHAAIGQQKAVWDGRPESFRDEIAPARTFGFLSEVEMLSRQGLIAGGSLENALVYDAAGPLTETRFSNEPARHKLLDAIGDLALLGRPLEAQVVLERPGHTLMMSLIEKLERLFG